mmetsp:Transcript_2654/g.6324  ORF Transcript_2654/g.6324 Transcript_2654/m.6324 type:complete len:84 (+) Transcript_2654:134-385(+)
MGGKALTNGHHIVAFRFARGSGSGGGCSVKEDASEGVRSPIHRRVGGQRAASRARGAEGQRGVRPSTQNGGGDLNGGSMRTQL